MPNPMPQTCALFSDNLVGGPSSLVYSCEMLSSIWKAETWRETHRELRRKQAAAGSQEQTEDAYAYIYTTALLVSCAPS